MHPFFSDIQRRAARWRLEHTQAAPAAHAMNMRRARHVGPIVAIYSAVMVLYLAGHWWQQPANPWLQGVLLMHLGMGLLFACGAWLAVRLRYAAHSVLAKYFPLGLISLTLLFCVGLTVFEQWVSPSINPFLIGALASSMVMYMRPGTSAFLYAGAYVVFFFALGITQHNPDMLLANRLSGFAGVAVTWLLSVLLWRTFTTLTLQHAELVKRSNELAGSQRELQRLTRLDDLTGLYNRATFVELTHQELTRAQRQVAATTLLLIDLDHFKNINDTMGHPAGDAVLVNVAKVANSTVRHTDLVGRLGGEEFMILLPNTSPDAGRRLAEKLRANIEMTPTPWEKSHIRVTVSIGVACATFAQKREFDELYAEADTALYVAKDRGRNQVF